MPLERDIIDKIKETFSPEDAPKVIELLSGTDKSGRIARCIVYAAQGNLETVRHYVHVADHQDRRDVTDAGEYDDGCHMRDFSVSFLIDSPEKMWISAVAGTMASRAYSLSSLTAVRVIKDLGPWYDLEGTARFEGDLGTLHVVKDHGKWMLKGDQADLELFNVAHAFDNERALCDAVSGYILSKRSPRNGIPPNGR